MKTETDPFQGQIACKSDARKSPTHVLYKQGLAGWDLAGVADWCRRQGIMFLGGRKCLDSTSPAPVDGPRINMCKLPDD